MAVDHSFYGMVQMSVTMIYVLIMVYYVSRLDISMLACLFFIAPCSVSIYGIYFVSDDEDDKRGGLSILLSFFYSSFICCLALSRITTICYDADLFKNGMKKLWDYKDHFIWITFLLWSLLALYFVVSIIVKHRDKIQKQIHGSIISSIFNYIIYITIFSFAFVLFYMSEESPNNHNDDNKTLIHTFWGLICIFINLCILMGIYVFDHEGKFELFK